jgi:tagatose-6-phosphate ketose/aldose isomerase
MTTYPSGLGADSEIGRLLEPSPDVQLAKGYGNTLREIYQQPVTWRETARAMVEIREVLGATLVEAGIPDRGGSIVITGSGSSLYAAECLSLPLQEALRVSVSAVPAGLVLTHARGCLPMDRPGLLLSLARSGDSPESRAIVDLALETAPQVRHLVITCNPKGALATVYGQVSAVRTVVLDEKTNDRSLVMTSSFTNMVLAGRALGVLRSLDRYVSGVDVVADAGAGILRSGADALARAARGEFHSVVYLGSGCILGAAHEAALKMLEMTGGQVWTLAESYLGLRHGPMSALREDSLVVAFLSSSPVARAYELDLLRELARKQLGARRVVVGAEIPSEALPGPEDVAIECPVPDASCDAELVVLDVLAGQLLAFFRCLHMGLHPDSPSANGVISRVVDSFEIHGRNGRCQP